MVGYSANGGPRSIRNGVDSLYGLAPGVSALDRRYFKLTHPNAIPLGQPRSRSRPNPVAGTILVIVIGAYLVATGLSLFG
jgi:hypothetical protein